jgi:S-adenosylmethionine hydrolase
VAPCGIVTLLTDFGEKDPFVGVMKGVILSRFPSARIVDLTHGIDAQDVVEAGFWLEASHGFFPRGTVHVAVVDPGVGTERLPIAADTGGHYFVAPDNGLLSPLLERARDPAARAIEIQRLKLPAPSRTFHGRDVFAPAAADLASGRIGFSALGPKVEPQRLPAGAAVKFAGGEAVGVVVTVDRFGNLITNIGGALLERIRSPRVVAGELECPVVGTYMDAAPGDYVALVNSFGRLEVARCQGDASAGLGLSKGARIVVRGEESNR